jgi:hypothetical protein
LFFSQNNQNISMKVSIGIYTTICWVNLILNNILWHDAWKLEQPIAKQRLVSTRSMEMGIHGDQLGTERAFHVKGINK